MDQSDSGRDVERHLVRYGGRSRRGSSPGRTGSYVYDEDGNAILDFTSGQMSAVLGHSHPDIVAAVSLERGHPRSPLQRHAVAAGRRFRHASWSQRCPPRSTKVLLLTTGAESNEAALKMAKLYTGGYEVVSFDRSWHGMTSGASAATYSAGPSRLRAADPGQPDAADAQRLPLAVPHRRRQLRLAEPSSTTASA